MAKMRKSIAKRMFDGGRKPAIIPNQGMPFFPHVVKELFRPIIAPKLLNGFVSINNFPY